MQIYIHIDSRKVLKKKSTKFVTSRRNMNYVTNYYTIHLLINTNIDSNIPVVSVKCELTCCLLYIMGVNIAFISFCYMEMIKMIYHVFVYVI